MSFTILLRGEVDATRQQKFLSFVGDYFAVCRDLDPHFAPLGQITHESEEGVTVLMYEQQMDRLTIPETRLFMQLVTDFYQDQLGDDGLPLQEEEVHAQEAIIEQILGQKEHLREEKSIVAYRDGGRVFVYNK